MKYTKLLTAAALTAGLAMGTSLPAQAADTNPNSQASHFDLQAHRGGLGLTVESTLASPWLGGIDSDDFGGDLVNAASLLGFDSVSPVHGAPQNGTVTDPGYVPYVTADMVDRAHAKGMQVIPWTVNDMPTMRALMDAGVDGLITDYPDRLPEVMAERSLKLPTQHTLTPGASAPARS